MPPMLECLTQVNVQMLTTTCCKSAKIGLKIDEAMSIPKANNIAIVLPLKTSLNMNDKQKNMREEYTIAKNINGANWRPLWAPKNQSDKTTPTKVVRPQPWPTKRIRLRTSQTCTQPA